MTRLHIVAELVSTQPMGFVGLFMLFSFSRYGISQKVSDLANAYYFQSISVRKMMIGRTVLGSTTSVVYLRWWEFSASESIRSRNPFRTQGKGNTMAVFKRTDFNITNHCDSQRWGMKAHFFDSDPILAEEVFRGWNAAIRAIDCLYGGCTMGDHRRRKRIWRKSHKVKADAAWLESQLFVFLAVKFQIAPLIQRSPHLSTFHLRACFSQRDLRVVTLCLTVLPIYIWRCVFVLRDPCIGRG